MTLRRERPPHFEARRSKLPSSPDSSMTAALAE
jgi:hypothetical protein